MSTLELSQAKSRLLQILRAKSVFHGDFTLASGAKSNYYIDCRLTTLDSEGAALVGQVIYHLIQQRAQELKITIQGVGGLTMGADPIALATGMHSFRENPASPIQPFVVRKAPKSHGQTKLIEGNFKAGDKVVVWNDDIAAPRYVRYAWADNPDGANLYNQEGLPASPFRTDQ